MLQANLIPSESLAPTVSLINGRPATTSLEVAKFFGKRHDHVIRDIRTILESAPPEIRLPNFGETSKTVEMPNGGTREEIMFTLYRDGFMLLVMGYTGKKAMQIKIAYILAFNAMEEQLTTQAPLPPTPKPLTPSTPTDRKPLRSLVSAWASASNTHYAALWPQICAHFQIEKIEELPKEWLPDALAFAQSKLDSIKALPSLSKPNQQLTPTELEELKEIDLRLRKLHAEVHTELGKISEQVFRIMSRRIRDSRLLLPLYDLMKLELRQAAVHDFHRISDYAMPLNWLRETLPAFVTE